MRSRESGSTTHTVAPGDSNVDVTTEVEVAHATEQGQSNCASDDGSEVYDTAGESEAESGGGQGPARAISVGPSRVSSESDNDAPYVYGDFAREIERWALFMGGPWPLKQGRGPVAIKTRHARRIRGKKSIMS
jgi:hypothetical protein